MSQLSHCVTAECAVPARRAYAFLSDGLAVGRWALGSFAARKVGRNLFRGRSLFDGAEMLYRPVGDAARLIVDYHVGTNPQALAPAGHGARGSGRGNRPRQGLVPRDARRLA